MEQDIFYLNDARVTKMAVKALRWLILVFPLLIILSAVGIFQAKINELLVLTAIAFAMVFSLFYYDNKFTIRVSIVSYILLVISLYFRSLHVQQIE